LKIRFFDPEKLNFPFLDLKTVPFMGWPGKIVSVGWSKLCHDPNTKFPTSLSSNWVELEFRGTEMFQRLGPDEPLMS